MKLRQLTALFGTALLLAACGGGGGYTAPPAPTQDPTQVPPSATTSLAAYVNYLNTLPASESGEPLGIDAATPPASDTDEPLAVVI